MTTIPVIDFQKYGLLVNDKDTVSHQDLVDLGNQMCVALETIGFCYLKNHGIDEKQLNAVLEKSKTFFNQTVEEKSKCSKTDDGFCGWIGLEKENLNPERPVGDYKETFNVTPDCNLWPETVPEFETTMKTFFHTCIELALRVFDVISVGLDLEDKHFFRNCHKYIGKTGNLTALRSLYYPAIPKEKEIIEGQVRCGEHSDYGTLTLLFQDLVGGLEVKTRDGDYIPATPIPGTIVVNIGDMMQRWTADRLIATKHRILIPNTDLNKRQGRQSVALFVNADSFHVVKCIDGSEKYPPVTCVDYIYSRFIEKL